MDYTELVDAHRVYQILLYIEHLLSMFCGWSFLSDSKVYEANMGPSGTDRTQVGPMLAPWTLLSGTIHYGMCHVLSPHKKGKLISVTFPDCGEIICSIPAYPAIYLSPSSLWKLLLSEASSPMLVITYVGNRSYHQSYHLRDVNGTMSLLHFIYNSNLR